MGCLSRYHRSNFGNVSAHHPFEHSQLCRHADHALCVCCPMAFQNEYDLARRLGGITGCFENVFGIADRLQLLNRQPDLRRIRQLRRL